MQDTCDLSISSEYTSLATCSPRHIKTALRSASDYIRKVAGRNIPIFQFVNISTIFNYLFTSAILSSDVSCRPVSVVLALPWPNVTDVQQMTPTHVTVQRWVELPTNLREVSQFTCLLNIMSS